jgi:hypothetical protein
LDRHFWSISSQLPVLDRPGSSKNWLGKLADNQSTDVAQTGGGDDERPIWEVVTDMMKDVPDEVFDRLPKDGASQVDHYIYGLPKRDE